MDVKCQNCIHFFACKISAQVEQWSQLLEERRHPASPTQVGNGEGGRRLELGQQRRLSADPIPVVEIEWSA